MKKGWSEVSLGELLAPRNESCAISPDGLYQEVTVSLWGKGVRLRRKVAGSEIAATERNVARAGDFIVSKIDARNGAYGFIPPDLDGGVVTNDFPLFTVVQNRIQPRWMYWVCRSKFFVDLCRSASEGTTNRVRLKESKFAAMQIPLPPLVEQQRIVAHLDAIESRLTRAQKLRDEQEIELKAVLSSAFHKLEADVTWKPLAEVAPLAWRQITIDPDKSYTEFGVRSFYKGIFLRRKVAGSTFSWQDLYRLKAGDIVFSNIMAWEKAIAVAHPEHDGWVGNHRMLVCEPRPEVVLPSYLLHYFMTSEGFAKILQASPGTAARNKTLKADNLMAVEVPVPSLSRQRTFESLCEHVARIRAAQTPQIAQISKVIPSLLDRLFNS
jgi:type I restriction enzyme, S subunit